MARSSLRPTSTDRRRRTSTRSFPAIEIGQGMVGGRNRLSTRPSLRSARVQRHLAARTKRLAQSRRGFARSRRSSRRHGRRRGEHQYANESRGGRRIIQSSRHRRMHDETHRHHVRRRSVQPSAHRTLDHIRKTARVGFQRVTSTAARFSPREHCPHLVSALADASLSRLARPTNDSSDVSRVVRVPRRASVDVDIVARAWIQALKALDETRARVCARLSSCVAKRRHVPRRHCRGLTQRTVRWTTRSAYKKESAAESLSSRSSRGPTTNACFSLSTS